MFAFIRFALGAAVGSFLNVVTLRYRPGARLFGKQLLGRSHCPHCGAQLRWFELVPLVSFVIQRGKCRSCTGRISLQYPLVELAAGLIAAGVPPFMSVFFASSGIVLPSLLASAFSVVWVFIFLVLLTSAVIDVREYVIPDELNVLLAALGIALIALMYAAPETFRGVFFTREYALLVLPLGGVLTSRVLGALCGGAFFALFASLTRGKGMGWGDAKLAAAGGLVLGLPDLLLSLFVAFIAGGVVGGVMLLSGRRGWRDKLPFGPFLVFGFAVTIFFGYRILQAYFSLL